MSSASAADALESFGKALKVIPEVLRKTLTYDQGKEMSYHGALTLRTGVQVYFADPHSPWQRGRPDCVRSRAWTWLFSSQHRINACSGGQV